MSQDPVIQADTLKVLGKLTSDNGNFATDGTLGNITANQVTVSGNVLGAINSLSITASAQSLAADSATITTAKAINRTLPTAARASMVLAPGTVNGQICIVTNEATTADFSITFAAVVATSNILGDGVEALLIADGSACMFVWITTSSAWLSLTPQIANV